MSGRARRHPITIAPRGRGGIRSVVEGYEASGFLARRNVTVIWSYEEGGFLRRQTALALALLRFSAALVGGRAGLVHCHVAAHGSFFRKALFAELARFARRPVVWHLHASKMAAFHESLPAPGKAFVRRQFEKATRVIVLSPQWRDYVAGIAPAARIAVVPNTVPLRAPHPSRGSAGPGPSILALGLVGERKGSYDLIEAFARVLRTTPSARLVIAGNGEVEKAQALADRLGIGAAVSLPGWIEGAAKEKLIAEADIYALPSYNEGLPVSVLEAMSAGLPVVTTPVGGLPDLIMPDANGLLVPAGDVEALAAALERLCVDPDARARLGSAGRRTIVERYAPEAVMPLLDAIYDELSADRSP